MQKFGIASDKFHTLYTEGLLQQEVPLLRLLHR